jgi:hypothetical protein
MAKNELKAQVKTALLKSYPEDVVRKGIARGERWIKAAYGSSGIEGWQERLSEGGDTNDLIVFFSLYCSEVVNVKDDKTFNKQTFGIYGSNR